MFMIIPPVNKGIAVRPSVGADLCLAHNFFFGLTLAYHIWHMGVSP